MRRHPAPSTLALLLTLTLAALTVTASAWADSPPAPATTDGVWAVTLHDAERGGCSRGFYNTDIHTTARLDLRDPLKPTLTLDAQSLYTGGAFDGTHHTSHTPQWGRDLWTLAGTLHEAPSGGTLTWTLWVVSHGHWAFSGYPSAEQVASPPQRANAPTNTDPDLTLTCTHQWLDLNPAGRAVTLACTLQPREGGDLSRPTLRWPEDEAGTQSLHLTQEAAGLEGFSVGSYGTDAITWQRPASAPAP